MIEADVILCWFSNATVALPSFTRPTRVIQLPTPAGQAYKAQIASFGESPILAICQKYAKDVRPLRIAVLGFSEGCQGARELLRSKDGGRVDAAIAIDGIHAQYQPGSTSKIVTAYLTPWAAMATRAVEGRTLMVVTASTIKPPTFASTTETAAWLWRYATGYDADITTEPVPPAVTAPFDPPLVFAAGGDTNGNKWPATTYTDPPLNNRYRRDRGLVVLNYADLDKTGHQDHLFQAKGVLPVVLTSFLAQRWNDIDPRGGICVLSMIDGEEALSPEGCFPPAALTDVYVDGHGDPSPLDIPDDGQVDGTIPGSKDDHAPPASTDTTTQTSTVATVVRWAAGVLGSLLLVEGVKYAWRATREKTS